MEKPTHNQFESSLQSAWGVGSYLCRHLVADVAWLALSTCKQCTPQIIAICGGANVNLHSICRLAGRAPLWGACCVWLEFGWTRRACTQDALNATLNYNSGRGSATRIEIMLINANTMHSILRCMRKCSNLLGRASTASTSGGCPFAVRCARPLKTEQKEASIDMRSTYTRQ